MKKRYVLYFLILAVGTVIMSCAKEEAVLQDPSSKSYEDWTSVKQEYALLPPYDNAESGQDAVGTVNWPTDPRLNFPYGPDEELPSYPFKIITTPSTSYLNETCLFNVSKLENNKTYAKLRNGSLTIEFLEESKDYNLTERRGVKLKSSSTTGWNSHWGFRPTVESENPDVFYFYMYNFQTFYIYLSKPCIEFGFEIAPNHKNADHSFFLYFGDYIDDNSKGYLTISTKSPSGARLYAIKATRPFRMITIESTESPTAAPLAKGMAIANIRYKLAK